MITTNTVLRKHLSNVIYIENNFSLDLFKPSTEQADEESDDFDEVIMFRKNPSVVDDAEGVSDSEESEKDVTIQDFFKINQNYASDINILPFYYEKDKFWSNMDAFKQKLAHFPLIIIDWRLENEANAKTGVDVFEEITKNNEILHYYVMYSNELTGPTGAIEAFKSRFPEVQLGCISENEVAVVNGVVVMFANKRTSDINFIIEKLETFTENTYGYMPQLFLNVKQQIENKTAMLYNDFMDLDSMMLPQLIADEAYNYDGLEDELLKDFIMNKLRNELKIVDNQSNSYIKNTIKRLLGVKVTEEAFNKAISIENKFEEKLITLTFDEYQSRCSQILSFNYMELDILPALKLASHFFVKGVACKDSPEEITSLSNKDKERIYRFILFLSICSDENYSKSYVKLYKIIKLMEYKEDKCFSLENCFCSAHGHIICQGDVFIDDNNNYLVCVSPSCQLMRPKKIKHNYMFLKGKINEPISDNQKQYFEISLLNKQCNKVVPVRLSFYDPLILNMSDDTNKDLYKGYTRVFSLHMEYIHKIVELFSEYIKQIGVEEMFGKKAEIKDLFVEN